MSIQVYRSSFPIVKWDLNDDDFSLTKAEWAWADRTSELPERGTPGQAIEWTAPSGYAEPTRAGFEFAGWSTNPTAPAGGYLGGSVPPLSLPDGAPESGEYTLYALWMPLEYSVIFELAQNPVVGAGPGEDSSFALNWSTEDGVRTVTALGEGRYRVSGFTMKEAGYDPVRRTVALPEPARTGYRFLGWSEDDGTALVLDGPDGAFELNPVVLTRVDGTPVLTARWASAFGVTAPLSITFGDYDKTGAPGNPSLGSSSSSAADDTTQSEADDTETPGLTDQGRYEAAGQAYFENTGWNDAIRMVAVISERDPGANQVLTTYDSSKATEAQVLGDGTAANPGERLLSLYPSAAAPADKATGVHFRLSDSLVEADLAQLPSLAAKAKQPVTYGLNLSTDPVTGSANHGLVLETQDYEPKQIATISYTFAVADPSNEVPVKGHAPTATGSTSDDFYIEYGGKIYGPNDIKESANCISEYGTESPCYSLYRQFLASGMDPEDEDDAHGYIKWGDGTTYYVRIIGINYDTKQDGSRAGLTFQFVRLLKTPYVFKSGGTTNAGGWGSSTLRTTMNSGGIWQQVPAQLAGVIASVKKPYRNNTVDKGGKIVKESYDKLFALAYAEVVSTPAYGWGDGNPTFWPTFVAERSDETRTYSYYNIDDSQVSQSYGKEHPELIKYIETGQPGGKLTAQAWWLRSTTPSNDKSFVNANVKGVLGGNSSLVSDSLYVSPCFAL